MHYLNKIISGCCIVFLTTSCIAQQSWKNITEPDSANGRQLTANTFYGTRLINMHTIESIGKRTLDLRISHRFGPFNSGSYNLWGLDGSANIRIGFDYSYDGRLMVGIGRSSYQQMVDGFLKYRLLRQTDDEHIPLSVSLFSGMYYTTVRDNGVKLYGFDTYGHAYSRMSYVFEAITARKFNDKFSAQIAPYFVHINQAVKISDLNDSYGVSAAFRYRFSKRMAVTGEYAYTINKYSRSDYYNNFGIGFEIQTGKHVFQFHVVNSFGIVENQFLSYTSSKWNDAGIRLGFNITRGFNL